MTNFPFYPQLDAMDCGATCLRMVARHFGRSYAIDFLREATHLEKDGVSLMGISDGAEKIGFRTLGVKVTFEKLFSELPLPCIAHWRQNHFVVVYRVTKSHIWVADPAAGKFKITRQEFLDGWASPSDSGQSEGIILLLETTPNFFEQDESVSKIKSFSYLFSYLFQYKKLLFQLVLGLFFASIIQIIFPFLTQSIVDIGIVNQDISFIYLILIAQTTLFLSKLSIEFIRSWILLHIGTRININLVSDFLVKLMKLPIRFFDTKLTGDLIQRIQDNHRVEHFLTSSALFTAFSAFNFLIFGVILFFYNVTIFIIFLISTVAYLLWILFFLSQRRILDYKRFDQMADNQSSMIELINGMSEIKLHNAEKQKRWAWEKIQAKLFKVNIKYLALDQYQRTGASLINESKNILITIVSAKSVTEGKMTLGMMLAVQYIIGQLNAPLEMMVQFILSAQDAKISLERMNEIHSKEDEDENVTNSVINNFNGDIIFEKVSFKYGAEYSKDILRNIQIKIPKGKTTAIVGTSGSGKTTLLKLMMRFYDPISGQIRVGGQLLSQIHSHDWREQCGAVLQDGFLFSESIAQNITIGANKIEPLKLIYASKIANIHQFIESLPLGFNTKIGQDGIGLSQGQKQRLLIARAVYKNPEYLFFDEATNALDAYNEMIIMENLTEFFKQKTVIIVAHRLSTVKNADNIIVLEDGEVMEQGTHSQLVALKGAYYYLIKNQLELGL